MGAVHKLEVFERRRDPRYDAGKNAIIRARHNTSIACIVENVSETGALLHLTAAAVLPKTFFLFVPDDRVLLRCKTVRVDGRHIGVEFIQGPRKLGSALRHDSDAA